MYIRNLAFAAVCSKESVMTNILSNPKVDSQTSKETHEEVWRASGIIDPIEAMLDDWTLNLFQRDAHT
jgi:hypothetical protein